MIQLQRLNLDSSWYLRWQDTAFVLDPWLIGSEVDGFRWLNEQWHVTEPVAPEALPSWDFSVITQSYSDHCHPPTLERMQELQPGSELLVSAKAARRLKKDLPGAVLRPIPDLLDAAVGPRAAGLQAGNLRFATLHPGGRVDPIYYALLVSDPAGNAIFYCPHGFALSDAQRAALAPFRIELLMTTFTEFRLPALLGGLVNPGRANAETLVEHLQPRHVVNTHDERKRARGLVSRFAKVRYVEMEELAADRRLRFVSVPDYVPVSLG